MIEGCLTAKDVPGLQHIFDEEVDTDVSGGEGQRLAAYASLAFHILTPLYYAYNALGPGLLCDSKVVRFGSSQLMNLHQLSTQKVNTICSLALGRDAKA